MADSSFQSYRKLRKIGEGGFGEVWLAETDKGHQLAAKFVNIAEAKPAAIADAKKETAMLKRLSHPNVVRFVAEKIEDNYLVLFTEFIDGRDLAEIGKISESVAKGYLRQICSGLNYLHSNGIVHRDIKGRNIMVTRDGVVKLIDFGLSIGLAATSGGGFTQATMQTAHLCGTLHFMAPEVFSGHVSVKSDVWALGITVYEMVAGRPPFRELGSTMAIANRITGSGVPPLPAGCSEKLQDFYARCTAMKQGDRPPVRELLQHQLFA